VEETKRMKTDLTTIELGDFFMKATENDLCSLYDKIINLPTEQENGLFGQKYSFVT